MTTTIKLVDINFTSQKYHFLTILDGQLLFQVLHIKIIFPKKSDFPFSISEIEHIVLYVGVIFL